MRGALTAAEAALTRKVAVADPALAARAQPNENYAAGAAAAGAAALPQLLKTVLSHAEYRPADEACSAWGASSRLVGTLEQLFRGPARHYYSIFVRKEPQTCGWEYHQGPPLAIPGVPLIQCRVTAIACICRLRVPLCTVLEAGGICVRDARSGASHQAEWLPTCHQGFPRPPSTPHWGTAAVAAARAAAAAHAARYVAAPPFLKAASQRLSWSCRNSCSGGWIMRNLDPSKRPSPPGLLRSWPCCPRYTAKWT